MGNFVQLLSHDYLHGQHPWAKVEETDMGNGGIRLFFAAAIILIIGLRSTPILAHEALLRFNPDETNMWAVPPKKTEKLLHFRKGDKQKLEAGCFTREQAEDCRRWGLALEILGKTQEARITWEKGCKLDDLQSCFNLGLIQYRQHHPRSAEIPWEKSCEQNHPKSCYYLGRLAREEKREKAMQIYYRKACDLGVGRGCADLSDWHRKKKGELLYARQLDYYACKEGLQDYCPYRTTYHQETQRTLRDIKTSRKYHDSFP